MSSRDYLEYRKSSYNERVQEAYDLYIALFGKAKADEWLKRQRPVIAAMKKLWKIKGFTNYGQYEDWEREHIPDRNEYLKNEGVWELWVNG